MPLRGAAPPAGERWLLAAFVFTRWFDCFELSRCIRTAGSAATAAASTVSGCAFHRAGGRGVSPVSHPSSEATDRRRGTGKCIAHLLVL